VTEANTLVQNLLNSLGRHSLTAYENLTKLRRETMRPPIREVVDIFTREILSSEGDTLIIDYSADNYDFSGLQSMAGWCETKTTYDLTERSSDPHLEALQDNLAIDLLDDMDYIEVIMQSLVHAHKNMGERARQYALIQQLTESP